MEKIDKDYIKFVQSLGEEGKITVRFSTGVDITEITEFFKNFLLAVGYHPETVAKVKVTDNDEIEEYSCKCSCCEEEVEDNE